MGKILARVDGKYGCHILLLGKLLLAGLVLAGGFVPPSGDEAGRALLGAAWERNPYFVDTDFPLLAIWLPLHFWIIGPLLAVWKDLWLIPAAVSLTFSLVALYYVYQIGTVFFDRRTGFLAAALYGVLPWTTWMALSGASEPVYQAFTLAGLYYLVRWLQANEQSHLWLAAAGLFLAGLVRQMAWGFAGAFAVLVFFRGVYDTCDTTVQKRLAASLLAVGSCLFWLVLNFIYFGNPIYFLTSNQTMINASGVVGQALVFKLLVFPAVMFMISPALSMTSALAVIRVMWLRKDRTDLLVYLGVVCGGILFLLIGSSAGFGTAHSPQRFVIILFALVAPFTACYLIGLLQRRTSLSWPVGIALAIYFATNLTLNFFHVDRYTYAFETGRYINSLYADNILGQDDNVLTEFGIRIISEGVEPERAREAVNEAWYQDALFFQAYSNHPERFIDGLWTLQGWENAVTGNLERRIREQNVKLLVMRSPTLARKFLGDFDLTCRIGPYYVLTRIQDPVPCTASTYPQALLPDELAVREDLAVQRYALFPEMLPNSVFLWLLDTDAYQADSIVTICAEGETDTYCESQIIGGNPVRTPLVFPLERDLPSGHYRLYLEPQAADPDGVQRTVLPDITLVTSKRDVLHEALGSEEIDVDALLRVFLVF